MRWHRLDTEQIVTTGPDDTFRFFADAGNLEMLTPAFLRFRIVTPLPVTMEAGARIEYRLRLRGMPIRWLTRIDEWRPGEGFVDRQLSGPYTAWIHRHTFEPHPLGTRVRDRVDYALPLDPLSRPLHALLVRPDLERIFGHRRDVIARVLGEV